MMRNSLDLLRDEMTRELERIALQEMETALVKARANAKARMEEWAARISIHVAKTMSFEQVGSELVVTLRIPDQLPPEAKA